MANALLSGIRRGRWDGRAADAAHLLLRALPVRLADDDRHRERAWELARRYDDHPLHDMLYVAVAERAGARLVTADAALRDRLVGIDWAISPGDALAAPGPL